MVCNCKKCVEKREKAQHNSSISNESQDENKSTDKTQENKCNTSCQYAFDKVNRITNNTIDNISSYFSDIKTHEKLFEYVLAVIPTSVEFLDLINKGTMEDLMIMQLAGLPKNTSMAIFDQLKQFKLPDSELLTKCPWSPQCCMDCNVVMDAISEIDEKIRKVKLEIIKNITLTGVPENPMADPLYTCCGCGGNARLFDDTTTQAPQAGKPTCPHIDYSSFFEGFSNAFEEGGEAGGYSLIIGIITYLIQILFDIIIINHHYLMLFFLCDCNAISILETYIQTLYDGFEDTLDNFSIFSTPPDIFPGGRGGIVNPAIRSTNKFSIVDTDLYQVISKASIVLNFSVNFIMRVKH